MTTHQGKCCFCCDFKTGVLVLGSISLIFGLVNLITSSIYLGDCGYYYYPEINEWVDSCSYYGSLLASSIIGVVAACLLLYGVNANKPGFLIPYIVMYIIIIVVELSATVFLFVYAYVGLGFLFLGLACLYIYFTYAVITYRKIMRQPVVIAPYVAPGMMINVMGTADSSGQIQPAGYPMPQGAYPAQPVGYPGQPAVYPTQPAAYPGQNTSYPGQPAAYPGQNTSYPGQPSAYPGQQLPQQQVPPPYTKY